MCFKVSRRCVEFVAFIGLLSTVHSCMYSCTVVGPLQWANELYSGATESVWVGNELYSGEWDRKLVFRTTTLLSWSRSKKTAVKQRAVKQTTVKQIEVKQTAVRHIKVKQTALKLKAEGIFFSRLSLCFQVCFISADKTRTQKINWKVANKYFLPKSHYQTSSVSPTSKSWNIYARI